MSKPLALIVEDEYDISIVFAKAIQAAGFETEIIRDGSVALSWLASAKPDLVLLDLNLPGVDGTGILKHIRGDPRLDKVNVVVATAYSHLAESLQSAADWVFFKPVSFGDLRDLATRLNASPQSSETDGETKA
jgi:DNA-binding response OmpR family regulator